MEISLAQLAAEIGATLIGDGDRRVDGVATLEAAGPRQVTFYANKKYKARYLACSAGAVIVGREDAEGERPDGVPLLVVDPAYLAFARVSTRFHPQRSMAPGIDPRAAVDASATVDPSATVLPFAYVGPGVRIGPRTVIHAHCAILENAEIGAERIAYDGDVVPHS
jgi:UDP-3-O-[3-hydroxymyristoyl] glucosamine N-acyltransferase